MDTNNNYDNEIVIPQPEDVTYKDRENSFGAYIMMFAGAYFPIPFAEIVFSIVYYSYYKKRSRYVSFHAYQSFLSQLPITIINTALAVYGIVIIVNMIKTDSINPERWKLFFIYLAITVAINIFYIIYSLVIAFKAKSGVIAYMPYIGRIAYDRHYGPNAINIGFQKQKPQRNRSPE